MRVASNFLLVALICLSSVENPFVSGFVAVSTPQQQRCRRNTDSPKTTGLRETNNGGGSSEFGTTSDGDDDNEEQVVKTPDRDLTERAASLKKDLLQLAASYDRGYGATKRARDQAESLISKLEAINPEDDAIRGIDGNSFSPLSGNWRMVWTTAADVLTLNANPLVTVGAIYQIFDLPVVTNVIDLLPPFETLLASTPLGSVLRAKVTTRAYRGKNEDAAAKSNRIGLEFQSVALEPVTLLGNDMGFLPPLGFDFPRTPFEGFFDVGFLDDELLIIRQNAPGGLFVLAKVDSSDP